MDEQAPSHDVHVRGHDEEFSGVQKRGQATVDTIPQDNVVRKELDTCMYGVPEDTFPETV